MGKKSTKTASKKAAAVAAKPTKAAKAISKALKKPIKNVALPTKPAKKVVQASPKKAHPAPVAKAAKAEKKAPKQKKPKVPSGPKGYTADQYAQFKAYKDKFNGQSNQALKDLLRKNSTSMTGNKDDLVFKCADGATLGRIPRCPKCFGGRPKFDYQKGTYYCSGYRDDTDFHNCHSTFQLSQLKREPWEP